jgi:hypothetical protein
MTQSIIKSAHGDFFLDHHIASKRVTLADQPYNPATGAFDGELWQIVDAGRGRILIKSTHGDFFLDHHIASRTIALSDKQYNPATGENNGQLWQIINRVEPTPRPIINGFSPARGRVGTGVTISGSNFSTATAVQFNRVNANFKVESDTIITTTVPANTSDGPITVTNPGGSATSGSSFDVEVATQPANLLFINTWMQPTEFPSPGSPFTVYFSFFNGGGSATGNFTIRLQLNNGAAYLDISAPSYAPGTGDYAYWTFPNGLPAGDHFFYAYLDVFNQVSEVSEADNVIYHGFRVR